MAVSISSAHQHLNPLSVKFKATILDDLIRFTVTHHFYNDSKATLAAANFTFPLLPEYSISDFCCSLAGIPGNNRVLRAIVLEKQTARNRFNDARKGGKRSGLLEQSSGDIFRSAVGNVPAEARIETVIEFAGFLKRRVRSDGTVVKTVTIPISISPRYGLTPPEWEHTGLPLPPFGLSAELQIHTENFPEMSVKLVSNHQECTTFERQARRYGDDDTATPEMTVVKIQNKDPHQKGDVVLDIIQGPEIEVPMAWLETHTTKSNHYAAMITLPKAVAQSMYAARAAVKREIIFLADRSGSMKDKIEGLRRAMNVFLKGIPVNRYFNVWCFGSQYESMWPRSMQYNEENLAYALGHVQSFKANMGGTEIHQALNGIIQTSTTDGEIKDVVVLTDGGVDNKILDATLKLVARAKHDTKGRMRFFALGIGDNVSHALVSGIAQAGGGYAEVIGTADYSVWPERMTAVLKAASEEHLGSVQVQVNAQDIVQPHEGKFVAFISALYNLRRYSLFLASSFRPPVPLQSPADLDLLPGFSRNRIFMLFDPNVWSHGAPSSVTITTRNSFGTVVRRENVTIHRISHTNALIHRLSARAAIGDLERGESWVQLIPGGPQRGSEQETALTKQEGVQLGREWNLVSKWTSFFIEESHHSGSSDPFMNTAGQSPNKNRRRPSRTDKDYGSSASSSEGYDLTPQTASYDGSPPLASEQWPKSPNSVPRHSGFGASRIRAKINNLTSSRNEAFKAPDNQRLSFLSHDTSRSSATNTVPQHPQDEHHSPTSNIFMENEDNDSIRSWILTDFDVSAPTFNPPASGAINEFLEVGSTSQQKTNELEKEKVLKLIDHQRFDGSFNFQDPQVAETQVTEAVMTEVDTRPRRVGTLNKLSQILSLSRSSQQRSRNRQSLFSPIPSGSGSTQIPSQIDINDFLGNDFKMLTKAIFDLAQLNPSLPDTIATIVLFERDLRDHHTLFSQSLCKAYTFVDGFIPDREERSLWMDYATAILSRTPEAEKPPLPKGKQHVCVCAVCGKVAEEQSYEAREGASGVDQNTSNIPPPSRNSFLQNNNNDSQETWKNSLADLQTDNATGRNVVLQPEYYREASSEYVTTQYYNERPRALDLFESIPEFRDKPSSS